jgi:hypothetical protein
MMPLLMMISDDDDAADADGDDDDDDDDDDGDGDDDDDDRTRARPPPSPRWADLPDACVARVLLCAGFHAALAASATCKDWRRVARSDQARSIHWSPYDLVGVVNAVP